MNLFVFRSLPLEADSRTQRNMHLSDEMVAYSCTWEKRHSIVKNEKSLIFPFDKSGNSFVRGFKYMLFILWIPYVVLTRARKGDAIIFMDLETVLLGGIAAKLKGVVTIFDIVDPFSQTKKSLRTWASLIDRLECFMARKADVLMVPHECRVKYYNDTIGLGSLVREAFIVENLPIYLEKTNYDDKLRSRNIRIGYFGTLDYDSRGLEFLIALAEKHPESISVFFSGQGSMEGELVDISKSHQNIHFSGGFNASQLPDLYNNVDFTWAYYCPKVKLHEYAAPNKFYEHLYFETPIITSSIIPQAKVINDLGSGVMVDLSSDSVDILHRALNDFVEQHEKFNVTPIRAYWKKTYFEYYFKKKKEFALIINQLKFR